MSGLLRPPTVAANLYDQPATPLAHHDFLTARQIARLTNFEFAPAALTCQPAM